MLNWVCVGGTICAVIIDCGADLACGKLNEWKDMYTMGYRFLFTKSANDSGVCMSFEDLSM